jgi:2'-5' RNA ligase
MHRLFVAIRPPEAVRSKLLQLMGGVSGARWQSEDQLHLTLRFIGEVDRHLARDVDAALSGIRHPAFTVAVSGVGTFERRGAPATLWAGVKPEDAVRSLQKKVEQALARTGLEPERRAYSPHITLARLPRGSGPLGGFLQQPGVASAAEFEVTEFRLYESRLTPEGAVHSVVERYPLA